jgi:hypothetical protein
MLSQNITREIDAFAEEMRRESPLFTNAREGRLGAPQVRRYLASIHHLIQHTPIHLVRARQEAERTGQSTLAAYYQRKWDEEQGHHLWAESDLAQLTPAHAAPIDADVSPAIVALVRHIEGIIAQNPLHYIAYTFLAEYFTVLCGGEWIELLNSQCGIPVEALSVVGNHVELDREHVREAIAELDALAPADADPAPFLAALRSSMDRIRAFYADVGGTA